MTAILAGLVLKIMFSAISALILISNHSPQQELIVVFSAGGHQGHLLMDGPLPFGERWCNNGAALIFIPA